MVEIELNKILCKLRSDSHDEQTEGSNELLKFIRNNDSETEWKLCLNKLVKGLVTYRKTSQNGFLVALSEFLREILVLKTKKFESFNFESCIDAILDQTKVTKKMKNKDKKPLLMGRLYGLKSLYKTNFLFFNEMEDKETLFKYVEILIELSFEKLCLKTPTFYLLHLFLTDLQSKKCKFSSDLKENIYLKVLQLLNDKNINLTIEGLSVYLSLNSFDLKSLITKIVDPKSNWVQGSPLLTENIDILKTVLIESHINHDDDDVNQHESGSITNNRIHFVYNLLLDVFLKESIRTKSSFIHSDETNIKKRKMIPNDLKTEECKIEITITFKDFWTKIIDQNFFDEKSSHEKKKVGFQILIKFLSSYNEDEIITVYFTPNIVRCLINQLSSKDRHLHIISKKVIAKILEISKTHNSKMLSFFSVLTDIDKGGCWNFDAITKTKTLDQLFKNAVRQEDVDLKTFDESLIELSKFLIKRYKLHFSLIKKTVDQKQKQKNEVVLTWYLDKILMVFKNSKSFFYDNKSKNFDSKFIEYIINWFIRTIFFNHKSYKLITDNFKKRLNEKFYFFLSSIFFIDRSDKNSWLYYVVIKLYETKKKKTLTNELDDVINKIVNKSYKRLRKIIKLKQDNNHKIFSCFELLYSLLILETHIGECDSFEMFNELEHCFNETVSSTKTLVDNEDSFFVIAELILTLISKQISFLKKISFILWESFLCVNDHVTGEPKMNQKILTLLYDILSVKENKIGKDKFFQEVEEVCLQEDNESIEEKDRFTNQNIDMCEYSQKENQILEDAKLKMTKVLDIENEEESLDSMNDDQMMEIDGMLSSIFKEKDQLLKQLSKSQQKKKDSSDAKNYMVFYKSHILDLLDIYNKNQKNSYLNLTAIIPLLNLIDLTLDKHLADKAYNMLRNKISKVKVIQNDMTSKLNSNDHKINTENILISLKNIFSSFLLKKNSNLTLKNAVSCACLTLSKNFIDLNPSGLSEIIDLYSAFFKKCILDPKLKKNIYFYLDFINYLKSV